MIHGILYIVAVYLNELMIFTLRPYQKEAVDATLNHFRHHRTPAVIVLPTGAGKSLVIAELARVARGRVLVLAHVKELHKTMPNIVRWGWKPIFLPQA